MNHVYSFHDYYNNVVRLSYSVDPFSTNPKHVWVICFYKNQWLLTLHSNRGLEFPGGKVEADESVESAAIREVFEETGAIIDELFYIGQYEVKGKTETIVKNIYFAIVKSLKPKEDYLETLGPRLLDKLPENISNDNRYSFIMKDQVLSYSMQEIQRRFLEGKFK